MAYPQLLSYQPPIHQLPMMQASVQYPYVSASPLYNTWPSPYAPPSEWYQQHHAPSPGMYFPQFPQPPAAPSIYEYQHMPPTVYEHAHEVPADAQAARGALMDDAALLQAPAEALSRAEASPREHDVQLPSETELPTDKTVTVKPDGHSPTQMAQPAPSVESELPPTPVSLALEPSSTPASLVEALALAQKEPQQWKAWVQATSTCAEGGPPPVHVAGMAAVEVAAESDADALERCNSPSAPTCTSADAKVNVKADLSPRSVQCAELPPATCHLPPLTRKVRFQLPDAERQPVRTSRRQLPDPLVSPQDMSKASAQLASEQRSVAVAKLDALIAASTRRARELQRPPQLPPRAHRLGQAAEAQTIRATATEERKRAALPTEEPASRPPSPSPAQGTASPPGPPPASLSVVQAAKGPMAVNEEETVAEPIGAAACTPSPTCSSPGQRCPVCLGPFKAPLRLACLHSLCSDCAVKCSKAGHTKCPVCRHPHLLDPAKLATCRDAWQSGYASWRKGGPKGASGEVGDIVAPNKVATSDRDGHSFHAGTIAMVTSFASKPKISNTEAFVKTLAPQWTVDKWPVGTNVVGSNPLRSPLPGWKATQAAALSSLAEEDENGASVIPS